MEATSKAVPNPTDRITKKKRRPIGAWFWAAFVAACGKRCCVCGKEGVPLQQGHILLHSAGGNDHPNNLIPVCEPCNRKYLKTTTPDNRDKYAPGWRERAVAIFDRAFGTKIIVQRDAALLTIAQRDQANDGKGVSGENGAPNSALYTQSSNTTRKEPQINHVMVMDFLLPARIPENWVGHTDATRAILAKVKAYTAGEPTEEECDESLALFRKFKNWERAEKARKAEIHRLMDKLTERMQTLHELREPYVSHFINEFEDLRHAIFDVTTLEELEPLAKRVAAMEFESLQDPETWPSQGDDADTFLFGS